MMGLELERYSFWKSGEKYEKKGDRNWRVASGNWGKGVNWEEGGGKSQRMIAGNK